MGRTKKVEIKITPVETTKVCPDCEFQPGLKDEFTLCPTCNGSGQVSQ